MVARVAFRGLFCRVLLRFSSCMLLRLGKIKVPRRIPRPLVGGSIPSGATSTYKNRALRMVQDFLTIPNSSRVFVRSIKRAPAVEPLLTVLLVLLVDCR